ncbi:MAG TPA: SRPBCC domain-containing protein [Chitinophaga sp.]|uniref:SRPBCC domain-containing protein n=1 Tax=Chitinophaga sp. TaxID=1869181 RepID=UPI002CAAE0C8|nr:SRPBCC domain-containing protein [Chitinophaga sp.]HVI45783.1 SRPBCC domain-containing protein [Chitinophaga sp.]
MENSITVTVLVQATIEATWSCWTSPSHIRKWNSPSGEWRTSHVDNDVRTGGRFLYAMESKSGERFDYTGTYDEIRVYEMISQTLSDGRKTINLFADTPDGVRITEIFEPEKNLPMALQQEFCTGVLNNFKTYVESFVRTL